MRNRPKPPPSTRSKNARQAHCACDKGGGASDSAEQPSNVSVLLKLPETIDRLAAKFDRDYEQNRSDAQQHLDRSRIALTLSILAAVLGAATAGSGIWTAWEGQRAAQAALASADTARQALVLSDRAWIAPVGLAWELPLVPGVRNDLKFSFRNTGRSPALDLRKQVGIFIDNYESGKEPGEQGFLKHIDSSVEFACRQAANQPGDTVFPSNAEVFTYSRSNLVPAEAVAKILTPGIVTVAFGCILYKVGSEDHKTTFCRVSGGDRPPNTPFDQSCLLGNEAN